MKLDARRDPAAGDSRTDHDLVYAARDGDTIAFDALFYRYRDGIFRLGLAITKDPSAAEEIVVDTFARAHRAGEEAQPERRRLVGLAARDEHEREQELVPRVREDEHRHRHHGRHLLDHRVRGDAVDGHRFEGGKDGAVAVSLAKDDLPVPAHEDDRAGTFPVPDRLFDDRRGVCGITDECREETISGWWSIPQRSHTW